MTWNFFWKDSICKQLQIIAHKLSLLSPTMH